MYSRPKFNETEEDILKLQAEFIKQNSENRIKPAATVVKDKKDEEQGEKSSHTITVDPQEHIANTFETIPTNINIGNVIQKVPGLSGNVTAPIFAHPKKGFPQAKRRDPTVSGVKGSIFSHQMKRLKQDLPTDHNSAQVSSLKIVENRPHVGNTMVEPSSEPSSKNIPPQSYILAGDSKEDIHRENAEILQQMSEREILEEQERLLSTMDPAIVAFLKAKRKDTIKNRTVSIAEQNKAAEDMEITDVEASKDLLSHPDVDKWLNFDSVEKGKLAWMTEIDIPKYKKGEQYEARFDFAGWLLPFAEPQIDEKNRALYHHGEEPGRPGYTLQELFQLCRSSMSQQKIVALNTIANILSLYQSGVYDNMIELPFEQIFFVLRFCLDDNAPPILNASIKAIRNLFFYLIDETCLDNMLGFGLGMLQPILAVDNSEMEDDITVNDQQLSETNLVKCLMRTDILRRIQYILNTIRPAMETVIYCIEILIRLARDSNFIVSQLFKFEDLLESIILNFLPRNFKSSDDSNLSPYGCPLVQAVKLCRILAARNNNYALILINRYQIMDSIMVYLSNEAFAMNSNGLKLQIECLHLWCTFLHHFIALDYVKDLEPILLRMFNYHVQNTNAQFTTSYILQGHTAALLNLVTEVFKQNRLYMSKYLPLINLATPKWTSQFCSLEKFSCGKLQIITAQIRFLTYYYKCNPKESDAFEAVMFNLLNSKGFQVVTTNIIASSNLLNNYEAHKSGPNLKSLEAAVWNSADHIVSIVQTQSCLPFLNILSVFVANCNNQEIKLCFLKHAHIQNYLKSLNDTSNYKFRTNWFTQYETTLIVNILKIAVAVQNSLDTSLYYEIAVKCLSVFNFEQKQDIQFILSQIVFSVCFYPCETRMSNLEISERNELLKGALQSLQNIFIVYSSVLNIDLEEEPVKNLSVVANTGSIMPVDWIYCPIMFLYSNQQQNKSAVTEEKQIFIITNCLRWIYIYETYFPRLTKLINATDRFCRIACTFLGSDSLFLNTEIHDLLECCLKNILKSNESDINFHKSIHGLNNFQDFYTQLLEQYQGVSYGDILFGNFILLPLMQRHDVKYRKLLWSEYAGVVQIFNVQPEQVFCPTELFLNPPETDMSLLKCYRKALVTGSIRKHSFFYKIAQHHVENFAKRKAENKIVME